MTVEHGPRGAPARWRTFRPVSRPRRPRRPGGSRSRVSRCAADSTTRILAVVGRTTSLGSARSGGHSGHFVGRRVVPAYRSVVGVGHEDRPVGQGTHAERVLEQRLGRPGHPCARSRTGPGRPRCASPPSRDVAQRATTRSRRSTAWRRRPRRTGRTAAPSRPGRAVRPAAPRPSCRRRRRPSRLTGSNHQSWWMPAMATITPAVVPGEVPRRGQVDREAGRGCRSRRASPLLARCRPPS